VGHDREPEAPAHPAAYARVCDKPHRPTQAPFGGPVAREDQAAQRQPGERGDRPDDEEQRKVPFDDEQDVRGDDPGVVPELVREQRFADSADEDMKPDEEWQTQVHGWCLCDPSSPR